MDTTATTATATSPRSLCPICADPATPAWLIARNDCPNDPRPTTSD